MPFGKVQGHWSFRIFNSTFRVVSFSSVHIELCLEGKKRRRNLVSLVLLNLLPETSVLLDANLLRGTVDELVETAEVHVLGQKRDHVLVEGLPVRVL